MKKFLIGFTLAAMAACAASTRHIAVVVDKGIYETLNDIHAEEQVALCGAPTCANNPKVETIPGWTLAKSQDFNKKLLPAVEAGRQYNRLLANWKPGTPVPAEISTMIASLGNALGVVVSEFPAGPDRTKIATDITVVQTAALNAFQIVLVVKGAQ